MENYQTVEVMTEKLGWRPRIIDIRPPKVIGYKKQIF